MILVLALAAQLAASTPPRPANVVSYDVGGLMSTPYRLLMDLDSGDVSVETTDRSGPDAALSSKRYRLAAADLPTLRRNAILLTVHGATAARCRKPGSVFPPPMDAFVSLSITHHGKSTGAGPNPACFSREADRFIGSVVEIIKRTPVLPD